MAIKLSNLFIDEGVQRNLEMLRYQRYSLEKSYSECLVKCEIAENGNPVLTKECQRIFEDLKYTKELLAAIDAEMFPAARMGARFSAGRQTGAKTDKTKYIHDLAIKHPDLTAKELQRIADEQIIGKNYSSRTFYNQVSKARNSKGD